MFVHNLNPTLLNIGPLEIRWYGLMYVLAFLVTYYYVRSVIRKGKLNLTEKNLDDLLGLMVLALIVGARLFYAIFYNPGYFVAQPWKIFFVWEGGLSFHGGLTGIILVTWWYAHKKNLKLLQLADVFCVPLALGNAFGRIGNFVNGELYGVVTDLPWGVVFPGVSGVRHPTQIYEALYNIIIFVVLFLMRNKVRSYGCLFGWYLVLYGLFRFSVEFVKDLPLYGPLTMGQWLTIPVFVIGIVLIWKKK
ncbi:prolipoprotein diacylglyceryl transferase [Candidatus Woesearchaeota archaeon CG10_big_fil_rev_8_21_14_0_10_37_12]|nr:MAG: prolipoprotein diacylglyceryl transferase [Candidatus Woesearchaeota archaeon CG10_big_fil_rev_8_21_14_0_10_37_12]